MVVALSCEESEFCLRDEVELVESSEFAIYLPSEVELCHFVWLLLSEVC